MPLNSEQISLLTSAYSELHEQIRANQTLEHKISFSVGGLFIIFAAIVLRRQFTFITGYENYEFLGISFFIAGIALISMIFLVINMNEMRWQCQRIVSCEQSMGLYRCGEFLPDDRILPTTGMDWGKKGHLAFNSIPFLLGVGFSAAAAIIALWFGFSEAKALQVHGNAVLEQTSVTALNSTLQKLGKTVDSLITAVNSLVDQQTHSHSFPAITAPKPETPLPAKPYAFCFR